MFCSYCGKQIADAAVVCVGCGRAITPSQAPAANIETGAKTVRNVARAFLTLGILNIIAGVVVIALGWFMGGFSVLLGIWEIICANLFWSTPPKVTWKPTYVAILEIVNVISGPFWSLIIGILNLVHLKSPEVEAYFAALQRGEVLPMGSGPPASIDRHKKCPKCAELIQMDATVCRFCGNTFSAEEVARAAQDQAAQMQARAAAAQQSELAGQQQRHFRRLQSRRTRRLVFGEILTCIGGLVAIGMIAMFFSSPPPGKTREQQRTAAVGTGFLLGLVPLAGGIALLLAAKSVKRLLVSERSEEYKKAEMESKLSDLLHEKTGDPAFLHRANWATAFGKKDFKAALAEVNQALRISPNSPDYLTLRAVTHYSLKNYAQVHSDLKAALRSNRAHKEALNFRKSINSEAAQCRDRARELSKKKEIQQALDELNRAVELEPDNPLNFFFRGLTYAQVENYDAAINDLTRTLQLDPQYPDGQKTLQSLKNVAGKKTESTSPTRESSEQSYFFVCTGNASLVNAYNDLFQAGARAYNGAAGHYYASVRNLDVRQQEASKASLPFVGDSYMGSKSTPVSDMNEILQRIRVAASRETHIAFVSVDQTGVSWVHKVYDELLRQAISQAILPYEMYVTKDKDAAQFLLGSFNKSS